MQTIELWNGRKIPRMGVGCWAIGGGDYGDVEDRESIAGLRLAYEMGARFFDTAAGYGNGHSERLLGHAFAQRGDVVIVTKFGDVKGQLSADTIRSSIEMSRANLQRDSLDLVLFHINAFPPEGAVFVFDALAELRQRGWLSAFGWSTDAPESVRAFRNYDGFVAVENDLNVFVPATEMMRVVRSERLLSIARLPLAMGLLSGKYDAGLKVSGSDIRASGADWLTFFRNGQGDPEYLRRLDAVRDLLASDGRSLVQGALAWILAHSERVIPVPGFKTQAQVQENFATLSAAPLSATAMREVDAVLGRTAASNGQQGRNR